MAAPAHSPRRALRVLEAVVRVFLGVQQGEWVGPEEVVRMWGLTLLLGRLVSKLRDRLKQRALADAAKGKEAQDGTNDGKELVGRAGQQFTLTSGAPADLSWLGAMPFYILPIAFGAESLVIWLRKHRGFMEAPLIRTTRVLFGVFAFFPFVETVVAHDWSNPLNSQFRDGHKHDLRFRASLHAWALVELAVTVNMVRAVLSPKRRTSVAGKAAAAVMLGVLNGGLGITVAHELLHKPRGLDKFTAKALLSNVCYLHWAEEHLVGHHQHVATPEDPATSRQGENLYAFLPRTVINSFKSSWGLYKERMRLAGGSASKGVFALETFGPPAAWVLLLAAITKRRLREVVPFFLLQAGCSVWLLEAVNYIEHYGLQRKQLADGSYEPVNPKHSWNSAHQLSNTILFKLQRHSDHHTFPQRPFQLLRNFEESPQLPTGYLGMVLLAACPPAFFWIMDPLVDAHNAGVEDMRKLDAEAAAKYRKFSSGVFFSSVAALTVAAHQLGTSF